MIGAPPALLSVWEPAGTGACPSYPSGPGGGGSSPGEEAGPAAFPSNRGTVQRRSGGPPARPPPRAVLGGVGRPHELPPARPSGGHFDAASGAQRTAPPAGRGSGAVPAGQLCRAAPNSQTGLCVKAPTGEKPVRCHRRETWASQQDRIKRAESCVILTRNGFSPPAPIISGLGIFLAL